MLIKIEWTQHKILFTKVRLDIKIKTFLENEAHATLEMPDLTKFYHFRPHTVISKMTNFRSSAKY